jgi:hypothetical protein
MKHVMGHDFREFDKRDWDCWAGAEPGSLICYCDDDKTCLILSPDNVLSEIVQVETTEENPNGCTQYDWTRGERII